MQSPSRYYPAFDKPPLCLAVAGADAMPGPLLVSLMTRLDLTASANRSILNRMVGHGMLGLERAGRVGVYRLAGRLLADFQRIQQGGPPPAWDGRLQTLIYDVPEGQRTDRERFRAAAMRAGYRPLRPGVLVGVGDRSAALAEAIDRLGVLRGCLDVDADTARLVAERAWGLAALREDGEQLAASLRRLLADLSPLEGEAAFLQLHRMMRPVVAWTVALGDLPPELLPPDWPGARLGELLGEAHFRLLPAASGFVHGVINASPHAALVEWSHGEQHRAAG